jgi:membrane protein YqaA with SNARE-associated domain
MCACILALVIRHVERMHRVMLSSVLRLALPYKGDDKSLPVLLPDVFCLMVGIFRLMLALFYIYIYIYTYIYIYIVLIFLQLLL